MVRPRPGLQPLGDVFADALEPFEALLGHLVGHLLDGDPGQLRRQRLAAGRLLARVFPDERLFFLGFLGKRVVRRPLALGEHGAEHRERELRFVRRLRLVLAADEAALFARRDGQAIERAAHVLRLATHEHASAGGDHDSLRSAANTTRSVFAFNSCSAACAFDVIPLDRHADTGRAHSSRVRLVFAMPPTQPRRDAYVRNAIRRTDTFVAGGLSILRAAERHHDATAIDWHRAPLHQRAPVAVEETEVPVAGIDGPVA